MKCLAGCLAGINCSMRLASNIDRSTIKSTLHKDLDHTIKNKLSQRFMRFSGSLWLFHLEMENGLPLSGLLTNWKLRHMIGLSQYECSHSQKLIFFVSSKLKLASLIPDKWRRKMSGCVHRKYKTDWIIWKLWKDYAFNTWLEQIATLWQWVQR